MEYRFHTADVFTDKAFGGNQLAVLPDARGLTTEQMVSITREFNCNVGITAWIVASRTPWLRAFAARTCLYRSKGL